MDKGFYYYLKRRRGLIIAGLVAAVILFLPSPEPFQFAGQTITLSQEGHRAIALLGFLMVVFITEALPLGSIVALVYAWVVIFGILPPKEASRIFSHDAAWFLIGALMIAQVLIKYGIHKRLLIMIIRIIGSKTKYISLGIITFCALSAAFISEHTVAALMLPVTMALLYTSGGTKEYPQLTRLLLFSIAAGCCIGGLGTPSGGGRNVVMIGFLEEFCQVRVGYGAWMVMAFPIVILLIPISWAILLARFKPEIKDLSSSTKKLKSEMKMLPMQVKDWAVLIIFFLVLFLWITKSEWGIGMIALLGTLLYLMLGLVKWKEYHKINWGIALLYFGAIGLGEVLQSSGAATYLAAKVLGGLQSIIPLKGQMAVTMLGTGIMSAMTQTMGDGPCVATIGPVLLESAKLSGIDPLFFGIATALSAAFAFMLIVGTPSNAIVYSSGCLRAKDFLKIGILLWPAALVTLWLVCHFWWGFLGVGVNGFH